MLTGKDRLMYDAQGHRARITTHDGYVLVGLVVEYTSALNNEPEISSLTMENPVINGDGYVGRYVDLDEPEIKEIELLD